MDSNREVKYGNALHLLPHSCVQSVRDNQPPCTYIDHEVRTPLTEWEYINAALDCKCQMNSMFGNNSVSLPPLFHVPTSSSDVDKGAQLKK